VVSDFLAQRLGVGLISSIEVVIGLWLGFIPPDSKIEWIIGGITVGGPILLTLTGFVSYFVLTRMGVDVPTDVTADNSDVKYLMSSAKYGSHDHE
jgi:hypothetical protein